MEYLSVMHRQQPVANSRQSAAKEQLAINNEQVVRSTQLASVTTSPSGAKPL
jgi:hypothetical protein